MLEVYVYDKDRKAIGIIDNFESLIWTDRLNEAGDFEIYCYASSQIFDLAKPGYYCTLNRSDNYTMVIETVTLTTSSEDGDRVIITGRSLESLLDRRIVWNKTHINGSLQDGLIQLYDEAFRTSSDANRNVSYFAREVNSDQRIADLKCRYEFYGDSLYDVATDLCTTYRIKYRVIWDRETNNFVFKLYPVEDRSYTQDSNPWVVYSNEMENLLSSEFVESTSDVKNVAFVYGSTKQDKDKDGNYYGLIRRLTTSVGATEGLDRKEIFVDATDIESEDVSDDVYKQYLNTRGLQELAGYSSTNNFSREVDTLGVYRYKDDYSLGDYVQFQNQYGIGVKVQVTEYTFNEDSSGFKEYPTFDQDWRSPPTIVVNPNLVRTNLDNWIKINGNYISVENTDLWKNKVTVTATSGSWEILYRKFENLTVDNYYTASMEYENITGWEGISDTSPHLGLVITKNQPTGAATPETNNNVIIEQPLQKETGYSEQISLTFKAPATTVYWVFNFGYVKNGTTPSFYINHIKCEAGEEPTVWVKRDSEL